MICFENVTKAYGGQVVLDGMTCQFENTGFYLLMGESGSGKTTFLNILAGFLPFEEGWVDWDGERFSRQITGKDVDYITQDPFFVDFLTMMDNLRMVSENDAEIQNILRQFGLEERAQQYPATLSGGERQRFAIIRAVLGGKKVILLDEPTAALDEDNKTAVFTLLRELKDDTLIVCSSHDPQALEHADEVIRLTKLHGRFLEKTATTGPVCLPSPRRGRKKGTDRFLKKWFRSPNRNRKAPVLFTAFLVLAMCLCMFADLPQNKMEASIDHLYKLNMFTVTLYGGQRWEDIVPDTEGIREVVLDYSGSVPTGGENLDPNIPSRPTPGYELSLNMLPYSQKAFRLADKVKYGTYFTGAKQVILSWEMAQALYPTAPEKLLGESLYKNIYGLGWTNLEIVGIFDTFTDAERMYLKAAGVQILDVDGYDPRNYVDTFFVSGKLTEELEQDEGFYTGSLQQRRYRVYFDSFRDMRNYYQQYQDVLNSGFDVQTDYSTIDVSLLFTFEMLFKVALLMAVFMMAFAVLFYIALIRTEFVYNSRFVAVFAYAGFSKSAVLHRFIVRNLWELCKMALLATAIAVGITWAVNALNSRLALVDYWIFSYNAAMIAAFLGAMLLLAGIVLPVLFRRVKVASWYESLIASRDLI